MRDKFVSGFFGLSGEKVLISAPIYAMVKRSLLSQEQFRCDDNWRRFSGGELIGVDSA
jgi:hypothetical protein